jgi:hypothetical protein
VGLSDRANCGCGVGGQHLCLSGGVPSAGGARSLGRKRVRSVDWANRRRSSSGVSFAGRGLDGVRGVGRNGRSLVATGRRRLNWVGRRRPDRIGRRRLNRVGRRRLNRVDGGRPDRVSSCRRSDRSRSLVCGGSSRSRGLVFRCRGRSLVLGSRGRSLVLGSRGRGLVLGSRRGLNGIGVVCSGRRSDRSRCCVLRLGGGGRSRVDLSVVVLRKGVGSDSADESSGGERVTHGEGL